VAEYEKERLQELATELRVSLSQIVRVLIQDLILNPMPAARYHLARERLAGRAVAVYWPADGQVPKTASEVARSFELADKLRAGPRYQALRADPDVSQQDVELAVHELLAELGGAL